MKRVIIVGAGIGGLSAAINLRNKNFKVTLIEASAELGGLARSEKFGQIDFDAGPYILLDKPGLEWSFDQLGFDLSASVPLSRLQHVYRVNDRLSFYADQNRTASSFDKRWSVSGKNYDKFVDESAAIHAKLSPHTYTSKPSPWRIIRSGQWGLIPFLLSNLQSVLSKYSLEQELEEAIGIWTHVAAQQMDKAPAPMSFVPSLIHRHGAYYPKNGMGSIASFLANEVREMDIEVLTSTLIDSIYIKDKKISGARSTDGQEYSCDILLCNMSSIGAYRMMPDLLPQKYLQYLQNLPLQSPGICVYLKVKSTVAKDSPYLQFNTKHKDLPTVAFVNPGVLDDAEFSQARLVAPLNYEKAAQLSDEEQLKILDDLVQEDWWKSGIEEFEVLHKRTSRDWGRAFHLYENSMNPVMTASFMRKGRIAHKSPFAENLFFCGSSTHPGQWVSFAAISGILSSNLIEQQYGRG